jgi:hypothetical protein
MKRLPQCFFALLLLISFPVYAADIFVATNGSDFYDGSKEKPFATLQTALRKARDLRRLNDVSIKDGVHIILSGGIYQTLQTIIIRPEDSGTLESPTFIEAAPNEKPIISGGVQIANWKKLTISVAGLQKNMQQKIWVADVPLVNGNNFNFRQLWVNDVKAVRAKSANGDLMHRILNWNKKEQTCMIPTLPFANLQNTNGVEMFIHQWWEIANLRIKKMQVMGDSTKLFFHEPESKIQSEHPWPAPWISKETGNSAFCLTNAIQFLDEPGEWYLDVAKQKIYYYPRANENLANALVIAPFAETVLKIEGNVEKQVQYVKINGLSFQHTGWLRPSLQGHVPHQAGMYMTDAYKLKPAGTIENPKLDNQAWVGRPTATVEIKYAEQIEIQNSKFEHLASSGVDLIKSVKSSFVSANLFKDIGGTAFIVGNFGDEGREIHLPYNPEKYNEICDRVVFINNFITNIANEDWGCVGVACGFAKNISINRNEIENVSYSAISLGWGWTKQENLLENNTVFGNKIHHFGMHNYDCGGIYTQSWQEGSRIEENYIDSIYKAPYAHLPSHWFYLYADEGSSAIKFINNWTPSTKFLQNNNGDNNVWENNGPQVSEKMKHEAGLQIKYQYLLKEKYKNANLPINEEHDEVIEIISKKNIDMLKLKTLLAKNNIDSNTVYQWQNHTVIFSKMADVLTMKGRLKNNFPESEVKVYYDLVYNFQKKNNCSDKTVAKEWDHILLTANLVADATMQQEYVDAHTTQFEKIPQIAEGFCNANFQQLLVFKNGRQLMLVISIPKGESLDKLNPKTTENNPQMIEWNKRMGKYQEGIEGTKKGESWVFFKKL